MGSQMLRGVYPERSEWAQHDTTGFGRSSSLPALGGCSSVRIIHSPAVAPTTKASTPLTLPRQ